MAKKKKSKSATPKAAAAKVSSKRGREITDEDRAKALEARKKNAPVRQFNTRYSDALRNLAGIVDEATQLTVAEQIAQRHINALLRGRVDSHAWRGLLAEFNDRTEGKAVQAVVIKRDEFDAKTWDEEQIRDFEEFIVAHKRGPTEAEQIHYRQNGKYPDAA